MANNITVKIQADIADLKAAMTAAGDSVEQGGKRMKESASSIGDGFNKLRDNLKSLAQAFRVFEALDWAKDAAKGAFELGDRLTNLSEASGISTLELQRLKYAASATGQSLDTVVAMTERASSILNQLRTGAVSGELLAAMKDLRLGPEDLGEPGTFLLKIADGLERVHGAGQRIADIRALFGRQSAEALPFLEELKDLRAEFDRLGISLDENAIKRLDAAGDAWDKLGAVWEITKAQITSDLAPALELVAKLLISVSKNIDDLAKSRGAQEFGKEVAIAVANTAETIIKTVVPAFMVWKTEIDEIATKLLMLAHPWELSIALQEKQMFGTPMTITELFKHNLGLDSENVELPPSVQKLIDQIRDFKANVADAYTDLQKVLSPEQTAALTFGGVSAGFPGLGFQGEAIEAQRRAITESLGGGTGGGKPPPTLPTPQQEAANIDQRTRAAVADLNAEMALIQQRSALGIASRSEEAEAAGRYADEIYQQQKEGLEQKLQIEFLGAAEKQHINEQIAELGAKHSQDEIRNATAVATARRQEILQTIDAEALSKKHSLETKKAAIDAAATLDQADPVETLRARQELADREYQQERQRLEQKRGLYGLDLETRRGIDDQIAALDAQHDADRLRNSAQMIATRRDQLSREIGSIADPIVSAFDTAFTSVIRGTQSVSRAFREMGTSILLELTKIILKSALLGGDEDSISAGLFGTKGKGGGLVGTISGVGESYFGGGRAAVQAAATSISGDDVMQAADAFTQVFTGGALPELSTILGVGAGSGTGFLGTLAGILGGGGGAAGGFLGTLASLASTAIGFLFEQGGIVPSAAGGMVLGGGSGATLALLHPYEMVLPRRLSERVQNAFPSSSEGSSARDIHYHVNVEHHVHAIDAKSFADRIGDHSDAVATAVRKAIRDGHPIGRMAR